jgi:hypothetical protein
MKHEQERADLQVLHKHDRLSQPASTILHIPGSMEILCAPFAWARLSRKPGMEMLVGTHVADMVFTRECRCMLESQRKMKELPPVGGGQQPR